MKLYAVTNTKGEFLDIYHDEWGNDSSDWNPNFNFRSLITDEGLAKEFAALYDGTVISYTLTQD